MNMKSTETGGSVIETRELGRFQRPGDEKLNVFELERALLQRAAGRHVTTLGLEGPPSYLRMDVTMTDERLTLWRVGIQKSMAVLQEQYGAPRDQMS